jgi:TonB-dependent SusC/RagA subfamily outer membrane receptor
MRFRYATLLLTLLAGPALGQSGPTQPDTARLGLLADSLAPPGTLRVQGQRQSSQPFLSLAEQLRTVAGVQVTPHSGEPGSWQLLRIRGLTNPGSESPPLVVLDGLPLLNNDFTPTPQPQPHLGVYYPYPEGLNLVTGPGPSPLLSLPLADVASVEVLKGAAATARYGAQGSNGVLVITTRRGGVVGSPQPLRLHYEGMGGVQQVRQRYDILDARQQAAVANELAQKTGQPAVYSPAELAALGRGSDWQDEIFRLAQLQSHTLSAEGSTARTRYYASAGYLRQTGVVRGAALDRYHLRAGLEQQLTPSLQVFGRLSLGQIDRDRPVRHLVSLALQTSPLVPVRNAAGQYASDIPPFRHPVFLNARALADSAGIDERSRRLLGQLGVRWQLHPVLRLTVQAGYERSTVEGQSFDFAFPAGPGWPRQTSVETQRRRSGTRTAEVRLDYQRPATGRHQLDASLAYLAQQLELNALDASYSVSGNMPPPTLGEEYGTTQEQRAGSVTAQARYVYNRRYELQASLRADGPGSLLPGSAPRTYWYAGAEACWHALPLATAAGRPGLSTLDLRAGWGQTSTILLREINPGFIGSLGLRQPTAPRTTQLDAGLDLGLLHNHLLLSVAAYQRRTTHAIASQALLVPIGPGFEPRLLAIDATALSRGLELSLGAHWQRGRLAGRSTVAASLNSQRIEAVGGVPSGAMYSRLTVGEPIQNFYLATLLGINPATGAPIYVPSSDASFTSIDRRYQGNGTPSTLLNLSQQLRFGRWELTAQVDAQLGYELLNVDQAVLDNPRFFGSNSPLVLDRWTSTNPTTANPTTAPTTIQSGPLLSTAHLQSGSHLRLTQLTLGYDFTLQTHPLTVWVGGQNLGVLTNYRGFDPNVSSGGSSALQAGLDYGTMPVPRTWLLGVRASF